MYDKLVILIPTYNPSQKLIKTIEKLSKNMFNHIIIVNDGSSDNEIFSKLNVDRILKHDVNMGKGAAESYSYTDACCRTGKRAHLLS